MIELKHIDYIETSIDVDKKLIIIKKDDLGMSEHAFSHYNMQGELKIKMKGFKGNLVTAKRINSLSSQGDYMKDVKGYEWSFTDNDVDYTLIFTL